MDITVIALALILFLVVFAIIQYNKLIRLNIQVDEGFSQIEVQLKRRADLIPNLVETVKGYATHRGKYLRELFKQGRHQLPHQPFQQLLLQMAL